MPKISALPAAVTVGASDLFAIVQGATTKKATASIVLTYVQSGITITESQVTGLTADLAAKLVKSANLSDLTSAATARTNLGLGTAAVLNSPIGMTDGGTGASLTAANGAIPYSGAAVMALLAPGSSGQLFRSGGAGAPTWTTATFPATAGSSGNVLVSDGTNFSSSATTSITALGAQAQALNMNTHLINNVVDPVSIQDAATMGYVLSVAQGRIFKDPSVAATTADFSATYANGASGVGATLTGTVMAAFAPDGVTLAVGDRVLFKNQASTLQNGIYTTTVLGTGAVLPVFTRATDMDQPSEFKGGTTFITGGSVNGGRTYTETATVAAVGTDAVTFVLSGDAQQTFSVVTQTFNANGTYTPTTGMVSCVVQIVGGGASGGGVTGATAGQSAAGSGGGGGGYCQRTYSSTLIGATAAVVIGAGGAGAAAGANNGNNGAASTFTCTGAGTTLTANGGSLGTGMAKSAAAQFNNGGSGGSATGGQVNIAGMVGGAGSTQAAAALAAPGQGGGSALSPPTLSQILTVATTSSNANPTGYGCGSSGSADTGQQNAGSADGEDGFCIITEYVLV